MNVYVIGSVCFVPHPCGCRGHWLKTHACIAYVECPVCGAPIGVPCTGKMGVMSATHYKRRRAHAVVPKPALTIHVSGSDEVLPGDG